MATGRQVGRKARVDKLDENVQCHEKGDDLGTEPLSHCPGDIGNVKALVFSFKSCSNTF